MKTRHIIILILTAALMARPGIAQETFISPDPTIVSQAGEFIVNINVDDAIQDFRGYSYTFAYDAALMEFTSAERGPLMDGFSSYWWRVFDISADSLRIECSIFGTGLSVDGPGTVLMLHFQTMDEGSGLLYFKDCKIYGNEGYPITGITANDGSILIDFAEVYTISGKITDSSSGAGLHGVNLCFSNDGGNCVTDENGCYSQELEEAWSGNIIPAIEGYHFSPATYTVNGLSSDLNNKDFTAAINWYTISGQSFDAGSGCPCCETKVYFGECSCCCCCNSSGYFCKAVPYGWTGDIIPNKNFRVFTPATLHVENIHENMADVQFPSSPTSQTFTIEGTITDANNGNPLQGIEIIFNNEGGNTYTNVSGHYSHNVPYGWTGEAIADAWSYIIGPDQYSYFNTLANEASKDYYGIYAHHISGCITDPMIDKGVPCARLYFSASQGYAETNDQGQYDHKLPHGWTGSLSPIFEGYNFSPGDIDFAELVTDQENINFTATANILIVKDTVLSSENKYWAAVEKIYAADTTGRFEVMQFGHSELTAGDTVFLKPGFHAHRGCSFKAYISELLPPPGRKNKNIHSTIGDLALEKEMSFKVYPNPCHEHTTFFIRTSEEAQNIELSVFDAAGNMQASKTFSMPSYSSKNLKFNTNRMKPGLYFYLLQCREKRINGKLIILE